MYVETCRYHLAARGSVFMCVCVCVCVLGVAARGDVGDVRMPVCIHRCMRACVCEGLFMYGMYGSVYIYPCAYVYIYVCA